VSGRRRFEYGVDVGRAALQLGDEKAQCRELFRDVFEVAWPARKPWRGEVFDGLCAFGQYVIGAILAEHQQRALDLLDRLLERGQRCLARGVAEEGVQRLFDGAEVGADFACHGFEQQSLLRPARHGVEMRQLEQAEFLAPPDVRRDG
jgi:hypothetical protein